jgi:uncharacterized protein
MPVNDFPAGLVEEHLGLGHWSILTAYRGSIAHGMYVPSTDPLSIDDVDIMGICVPPRDYYLGLREFGSRGTQEIKRDQFDIVVYELRKLMRMLRQGNPNVLALLWLDEDCIIRDSEAWRVIRNGRDAFVGKHVYNSFVGYAHGQLKRITHYKCEGYMGEKRKRLVDQFGYDCKNAAHLIRLLRMGIEFLGDGVLRVKREDAEELLRIKRGEWTLAQVKAESDRLFDQVKDAVGSSPLPDKPNDARINYLCATAVERAWAVRGETWDPIPKGDSSCVD